MVIERRPGLEAREDFILESKHLNLVQISVYLVLSATEEAHVFECFGLSI